MTSSFTIPSVETARLILRAPQAEDLPGLTAFFATKRSHMVGGPKDELGSWQSLTARIGHWALGAGRLWPVAHDREMKPGPLSDGPV